MTAPPATLGEAGRRWRSILGILLGLVARVWLATLRVRVEVSPALASVAERPWVLAFLHGEQWPLLAWKRRRPTAVMVSLSPDGQMQARALGLLGFEIVRGSSSRQGARGLAGIIRRLRAGGADAAFAVDGPRGPYGVAKPGALVAAARAGGVVVPMGAAVRRGKVMTKAWDRFVLAWPFSEVVVVLGAPLRPFAHISGETALAGGAGDARGDGRDGPGALTAAVLEASDRARAILSAAGGPVVRFSLPLSGADGE